MFDTSVDKILTTFTTAITKLERLSDSKVVEAATLTEASNQLADDAGRAKIESRRADIVCGKLKELIGDC
jgi:hypothetical protein